MRALATGTLASLLLVLNTLFWGVFLFSFTLLKIIIPIKRVREKITTILTAIANGWISGNSGWMILTQKINWRVSLPESLDKKGWYFVISNHQSWVDILVLQHCLNGRIPLLKFFLKQELIRVPIMGAAWWALDFPFMKRYSLEYLKKHPEKRGQDLETTRKACEKFKVHPTCVMNFLEGTRFTEEKQQQQKSPYQHLLKPKTGGIAFAMSAMGSQFKSLLDVTIYYPQGIPTFADFIQGKMERCQVVIRELPIPESLRQGDYENDSQYRIEFQQWIQQLWQEKDALLEEMKRAETAQSE